jgi:hypothetical protein
LPGCSGAAAGRLVWDLVARVVVPGAFLVVPAGFLALVPAVVFALSGAAFAVSVARGRGS